MQVKNMNFRKIYYDYNYDEAIKTIWEVVEAEKFLGRLIDKLMLIDSKLALEMDDCIGVATSAYELQGFIGGIEAARKGWDKIIE